MSSLLQTLDNQPETPDQPDGNPQSPEAGQTATPPGIDVHKSDTEVQPGPREFIRTLEILAQFRIGYFNALQKLYSDHGHIVEKDESLIAKPGIVDSELAETQWELFRNQRKELFELPISDQAKEFVGAYVVQFERVIDAKRAVCHTFDRSSSLPLQLTDATEMDKNAFYAREIFMTLYPQVENPYQLNYFESPVGIVFTVQNVQELMAIRNMIDPEHPTVLPIGGFASYPQITRYLVDREPYSAPVGISFLINEVPDNAGISVNKMDYTHEDQHILDLVLLAGLDSARNYQNAIRREHKKETRLQSVLSQQSLNNIKTEIFAYEMDSIWHPRHRSAYMELTTLGNYNYDGVLGEKPEDENTHSNQIGRIFSDAIQRLNNKQQLSSTETQTLTNEYKTFIRESTAAFQAIQMYYQTEFKDERYSQQMTMSVLAPFPLEDWPTIKNAVFRYSQFDTYRIEHEKWVAEIHEQTRQIRKEREQSLPKWVRWLRDRGRTE